VTGLLTAPHCAIPSGQSRTWTKRVSVR